MSLNDYEITCANLVKSIKAKIEEAKAEGTFKVVLTNQFLPESLINYFKCIGYEIKHSTNGVVIIHWFIINDLKFNTKQLLSCQ